MAAARHTSDGKAVIEMPEPLAPSAAALLRRILALHAAGATADASDEIDRFPAQWMVGALLADGYLSGAYQPTDAELASWLDSYGDQPETAAIRMLLERNPPRQTRIATNAQHVADRLAGQIRGLFAQNRDADALALATPLLHASRPGADNGEALFVAGLAARRLERLSVSRELFETAYATTHTSRVRAAAAFWMAKSQNDDPAAERVWLRRSARETDTFYGWIAHKALGASHDCIAGGSLGSADLDALTDFPSGRRAFAWLQAGEKSRAEQELRSLWREAQPDPSIARALFLVAQSLNLRSFAGEIRIEGAAKRLAAERQPLEKLAPVGGFLVDPPLVYALVRRESNFSSNAVSVAGARGLMQIMPATARGIGPFDDADVVVALHNPGLNLSIGQKYLLQLDQDAVVGGDLIRMLAAYEQGPSAVRRWVHMVNDGGDPLMFLEAVPNQNTRLYVEQTLTHAWRYAVRFRFASESLEALAAGRYPGFTKARSKQHNLEAAPAACPPLRMR